MSTASQSWLGNLLHFAAEETELGGAGSETMLAKVAEVIFVEIIRKHIARLPEVLPGWLSALRDRHIGQAMRLIHGHPKRQWTLETLAHEIGLSRSVFADRFAHYVGLSPMQYLARWRMQLAARRLEIPGISIAQFAGEVGYESEAAFNRSFKNMSTHRPGHGARGVFLRTTAGQNPCRRHRSPDASRHDTHCNILLFANRGRNGVLGRMYFCGRALGLFLALTPVFDVVFDG